MRLILLILLLSVIGCNTENEPLPPNPPPQLLFTLNGFNHSGENHGTVYAGSFGMPWKIDIRNIRTDKESPLQSKFFFTGPGEVFQNVNEITPETHLVPLEFPVENMGLGLAGIYRPPSIDEAPQEIEVISFSCEALNPNTNKWDQSSNYKFLIAPRKNPMDFYFDLSDNRQAEPPVSVTITAGEVYSFAFIANPFPTDGIQLQYDIEGINGYTGESGDIKLEPGLRSSWPHFPIFIYPYYYRGTCTYTAPEDIASSIDIVAKFSIYDPWIKERREIELTFNVVPKE